MNEITTLAGATVTTVTLAISALIIGLVLAMLFTAWESAKWKAFAFLGTCWVTLIRGLPEMLVVLFVYYGTLQGVMMLMDGIELGSFTLQFDFGDTESLPFYCGVIALSLLYASYASQTLRGALKPCQPDSGKQDRHWVWENHHFFPLYHAPNVASRVTRTR